MLLYAHDPDTKESIRETVEQEMNGQAPAEIDKEINKRHQQVLEQAVICFHQPDLRDYIVEVRKKYDQIIDMVNMDMVTKSAWVKDQKAHAEELVNHFKT